MMLILSIFSLIIVTSSSYDEYSFCDRQARSARLLDILPPDCDISSHGFCYQKGQAYPDKAIKRFLKENLGLMKRMSSDMDSREVVREMRSGFNHWTDPDQYEEELEEEEEFDEELREDKAPNFKINMMPPGENIFNGLKYNFKYGSGLTMIKNAKDNDMEVEEVVEEEFEEVEEVLTTTTKTTTSQTTMIVTTLQSTSSERTPSSAATTMTTMTREEYIEPSTVTEQLVSTTVQDNIEQDSTYTLQNSLPPTELPVKDYLYDVEDYPTTDYNFLIPQQELPVVTTENIEEEKTTEMFEEVYDYSGESINACEVEESVTAPYWANNTRNHTLALLNLYPFEQYIHMEICKAEYDEMLCRPGCRCEQQYRLQRLLAFDPSNECRGVFSDWFRFPSFCICKCYDGARQLREMGRNPKSRRLSKSRAGPGPTHNTHSRLANHRLMAVSGMEDMPAVFPFEGLKMIEDEQNMREEVVEGLEETDIRLPRKMERPVSVASQVSDVEEVAVEHLDNTVESDQVHYMKTNKQARLLDDNFFYNQPIVDFKLSDGTMGSVEQVPRK